jgi:hypothetical protein
LMGGIEDLLSSFFCSFEDLEVYWDTLS